MLLRSNFLAKLEKSRGVSDFLYSPIAIIMALLIGALLIFLSGYDVSKAYLSLFEGIFGNVYNVTQTLLKMIPLIFTGLAVAIGFRSGLFNIGGEGQLYWGAFATAIIPLTFPSTTGWILIPLSLLAGASAGAVWGMIPGYIKAKTGAHEVVTTIMMNYIGILATTFLLRGYFKEPGPIDQTPMIPKAVRLAELIPHTRLTWALFLGITVIIIMDLLFKKTSLGYDLQAVGENAAAAEYAGIDSKKMVVISMGFCGAAAGLAGSTMVLGVLHRFITNFSPGYGFVGIAVAVLGRNRPWGVLLSALLFGALEAGGISMQLFAKIPMDLMTIIQGLVILFIAAPTLIQMVYRLGKRQLTL
ncbi:MAG: ABC transporter permease [Pseudomonadota bacterium]